MVVTTILVVLAAFLGSFVAQHSIDKVQVNMKHFFAFSGAFLFGLTVTHLFPMLYSAATSHLFSLLILVGFLLQLILEKLTKGIEHGHLHLHNTDDNLTHHHIPFSVMFGLSIHSFLEGLPLAQLATQTNSISIGIIIHKVPEAMALMSVLMCKEFNVKRPWLLMIFFALLTPLGTFAGYMLQMYKLENLLQPLVALVAGSFIHIASTIIFESGSSVHHVPYSRIIIISIGFAIAACL